MSDSLIGKCEGKLGCSISRKEIEEKFPNQFVIIFQGKKVLHYYRNYKAKGFFQKRKTIAPFDPSYKHGLERGKMTESQNCFGHRSNRVRQRKPSFIKSQPLAKFQQNDLQTIPNLLKPSSDGEDHRESDGKL